MWDTLTWHDVRTAESSDEIGELRVRTVQFLTGLSLVGYLVWHLASLTAYSALREGRPDVLRPWLGFILVLACLGSSYLAQQQHWRWATESFFAASLLVITGLIAIFRSPTPITFYPLLTLAAVVLLQPLAGAVVCFVSIAALAGLAWAGPFTFLGWDRILDTSIAGVLTIVIAWVLGRNLVIAVKWAMDSYAQARQSEQDARNHRAELYQALKQLDSAYYRLERANAALELAWRAAETAEQSKTEFVSNISHELRTPLNLIAGFSEMILTSPESYNESLPAAYRGDLHAIYRSAQHLLTLSEDILDLTRVGIGRLSLAREPVDLNQVIRDTCEIAREYINAKKLRLTINLPEGLPPLLLDRLRIRQVLLNLLTNAARFTDTGGITITAVGEADRILIRVTDTGRGIAPDDLTRVFDEFYHLDPNRRGNERQLGGIGLGLSLSKRFVELHGGQMGVESQLGVGTTFWFTLPHASDDAATPGSTRGPLRLPTGSVVEERILISLGGGRQVAQFIEHHLRGFRVLPAPDLSQALEVAQEYRALAILTDLETGADLARGPDLPVPVIRLPFPHPQRLARALGAAAYLMKPIARGELGEAVHGLGRPIQRALVVDDDPHFVRLVTRYLRWIVGGDLKQVRGAHSGREALSLLETIHPDLVILDLEMGDLSGREVLRAMAQAPELADVPVIVISAHTLDEAPVALSGSVWIHKSEGFQWEELLNLVESVLRAIRPPRRYLTGPSQPIDRARDSTS